MLEDLENWVNWLRGWAVVLVRAAGPRLSLATGP